MKKASGLSVGAIGFAIVIIALDFAVIRAACSADAKLLLTRFSWSFWRKRFCSAVRRFVVRGSPDPARVLDRRSPSFGVCSASTNASEATACGERGRPSVRHSGGVGRPAPNTKPRRAHSKNKSEINHGMALLLSSASLHRPRVRVSPVRMARSRRLPAGAPRRSTNIENNSKERRRDA